MKRKMTFRFRKSMTPSESELGYFGCELTYSYKNADLGESTSSLFSVNFFMSRDHESVWRIVPGSSDIPSWIYKHELQFGNAIDESLGIKMIMEIKAQ